VRTANFINFDIRWIIYHYQIYHLSECSAIEGVIGSHPLSGYGLSQVGAYVPRPFGMFKLFMMTGNVVYFSFRISSYDRHITRMIFIHCDLFLYIITYVIIEYILFCVFLYAYFL
jgi:hypothetical protein